MNLHLLSLLTVATYQKVCKNASTPKKTSSRSCVSLCDNIMIYKQHHSCIHMATVLCEIMGRHGSDKGSKDITKSQHNYTLLYHHLFDALRDRKLRVFELGLGTNNVSIPSNMGPYGRPGASLYGWAEYFPVASIYGADVDRGCLFDTERIKTYYCDQTSPADIAELWSRPELQEPFDIMVEDGLHTYDANICFLVHSLHKLSPGGYYIMEDIVHHRLEQYAQWIRENRDKYPDYTFELIVMQSTVNTFDNCLMVVHRTA
jgi:hypothetical protein